VWFITWSVESFPEALDRLLARKPRAVMLSFGDPRRLGARVREAGVPLICQVQSRADAIQAIDAGADVVVAQGAEAGGHGDSRGTFTLVPELADLLAERAPETLLCAAGGVSDGRGLAAALMLGADGVLIGTRLWATNEAKVPAPFHAAALAADGDATIRTGAVDIARQLAWPSRFTARVLRNRFTDNWDGREAELQQVAGSVGQQWVDGYATGDTDRASPFVGEAIGLIVAIEPAAVVVKRIAAEAAHLRGSS
jgi:nitronate monooxygenase